MIVELYNIIYLFWDFIQLSLLEINWIPTPLRSRLESPHTNHVPIISHLSYSFLLSRWGLEFLSHLVPVAPCGYKWLSQDNGSFLKSETLTCSDLYYQCLAHYRCSTNICWKMTELMNITANKCLLNSQCVQVDHPLIQCLLNDLVPSSHHLPDFFLIILGHCCCKRTEVSATGDSVQKAWTRNQVPWILLWY